MEKIKEFFKKTANKAKELCAKIATKIKDAYRKIAQEAMTENFHEMNCALISHSHRMDSADRQARYTIKFSLQWGAIKRRRKAATLTTAMPLRHPQGKSSRRTHLASTTANCKGNFTKKHLTI